MEWSDTVVVVFEVLIAPVILLVVSQVFQFRGWCKLPALYSRTEIKIMFRPIQKGNKNAVFEYGEAMIGTKPLIEFRNDMIDCMNRSQGGLLCLCAPFGHGKTATVIGAALGRLDGMPQRALFLGPGEGGNWFTRVKQLAGLPLSLNGADAARHLVEVVGKRTITTRLSKRLRFLDGASVKSQSLNLMVDENYGVLVIEDYSPKELRGKDNETVAELMSLVEETHDYIFLSQLTQKAHNGRVVVVITTTCKNALRLIHHGINGGHKAKAAPSTTTKSRDATMGDVEIPGDYCGMTWDRSSRQELFSKKYAPYTETQAGRDSVDQFSRPDRDTVRDCCQNLFVLNGCTCAKLKPTFGDYATDYMLDPLRRLICCQPACSLAPNCIDDEDYNVELGEPTTRYGTMS